MIALNHFIRQRELRSVFRGVVGGVVAHVILFLAAAGPVILLLLTQSVIFFAPPSHIYPSKQPYTIRG